MPCYQVRTVSVEFKVENAEILKRALQNAGFTTTALGNTLEARRGFESLSINMTNGRMSSRVLDERTLGRVGNLLKREYSEVVLEEVAKKQKWIKKKLGEGRFQLVRY